MRRGITTLAQYIVLRRDTLFSGVPETYRLLQTAFV